MNKKYLVAFSFVILLFLNGCANSIPVTTTQNNSKYVLDEKYCEQDSDCVGVGHCCGFIVVNKQHETDKRKNCPWYPGPQTIMCPIYPKDVVCEENKCKNIADINSLASCNRLTESKDLCYAKFGMCNLLVGEHRDKCYYDYAQSEGGHLVNLSKKKADVNQCDNINNLNLRDQCYYEVGYLTNNKDVNLCNRVSNLNSRDSCIINVATATSNVSLCRGNDECYLTVATQKLDVLICDSIPDSTSRKGCRDNVETNIITVAEQKKDKLLCEKITDSETRNRCIKIVEANN